MGHKDTFKDIFRMVYSSRRIGVAIVRSDGKVQFSNAAFKLLADLKGESPEGRSILDVFPPYGSNNQKKTDNFFGGEQAFETEYLSEVRLNKTKVNWLEINILANNSEKGLKKYLVLINDVTELINSKERLEVTVKQSKEAEHLANLGHWEWDLENNILHWSDQLYRIFGLEPKQIVPSYNFLIDSIYPDDREVLKKKVKDSLEGLGDYKIESRIVLEDGEIRYIQTSGIVTFGNNNKPVKMLGATLDITEQKEKEIEISKLNIELKSRLLERQVILESINEGIVFINAEGFVIFINEIAKKVLGAPISIDVYGKNIRKIPLIANKVEDCLIGKTFINEKINFIHDEGRFQYLISGKPIEDSEEKIIGALVIMTDISEVKTMANVVSESSLVTFSEIIGKSKGISAAISKAQLVAETNHIASIYGESGTGKELFASAIHQASKRKGPFVPINCAALPENLLESELFGYEKGAFTSAGKDGKKGLFEFANNGTVFLDEIGEIPQILQAKLLRAIQEGKIRRIGGNKEIGINARIITATNRNLKAMVEKGEFREDLFYRINVFPIDIPPLRDRTDDIIELVKHFVFMISSNSNHKIKSISDEAIAKIIAHSWPGNVRELRNVIQRASILCLGEVIESHHIIIDDPGLLYSVPKTFQLNFRTDIRSLRKLVEEYEKQVLIEKSAGAKSIRKLAEALGLSHTAMIKKLNKYNLKISSGDR